MSATGLVLAAFAALIGAAFTRLTVSIAHRIGAVSSPNPIVPQHTRTVAYLGGVAIAGSAALALTLWTLSGAPGTDSAVAGFTDPAAVISGAAVFLALGTLDDLRPLSPACKLAAEVIVAAIPVGLGLRLSSTGLAELDAVASVLLIVVVINALNVTDVCDGLVGGLSCVALLFYSILGSSNQAFALSLAGACAGFLIFNFPPAKIFLGDAGTHLLGFCVASLVIVNANEDPQLVTVPVVALTLGVPLFEVLFVTVVRTRKGLPWWRGSPDHYSLRLQAAGLSRGTTAVLSWIVATLLCATAWIFSSSTAIGRVTVAVVVLGAVAAFWRLLLRWEVVARAT